MNKIIKVAALVALLSVGAMAKPITEVKVHSDDVTFTVNGKWTESAVNFCYVEFGDAASKTLCLQQSSTAYETLVFATRHKQIKKK